MIIVPKQRIDWKKSHITKTDLDTDMYDAKFKLWDKVVEENLLDSPSQEVRKDAWHLLTDPTIWTYAFFNDPKNPKQRLVLTPYQDVIAQCKHDGTALGDNRYLLFRAANQLGKSILLCALALYHALNEDNVTILMISKSLPQSQDLLRQIKHLLNNSIFADTWKEDIGDTSNTTQLTFTTEDEDEDGKVISTKTSRIICAPAGEGALGYAATYMFIDEADFYDEGKRIFWKVLKPRTHFTKGQIILFSNPNPDINTQESVLHELWIGSLFKKKFHFTFLDCPWNTKEEFDIDRINTVSHIFASTHLGEWSDLGGSFFTQAELKSMLNRDWNNSLPLTERPIYIGVDLGRQNDNTVISVGYVKEPVNKLDKYLDLDVPYIETVPLRTPYTDIVKRIQEIEQYYEENNIKIAGIGYDNTGQKTFEDMIKKEGVNAIPVDFAAKKTNKTQLYNDFKLMSENSKIKIVHSLPIERQLAGLNFKLTENKRFRKVESKSETIHDDIPDSLAILIHISVTPSRLPVSIVTIDNQKAEEEYEEKRDRDAEIEEFRKTEMRESRQKNSMKNLMRPW